MLLREEEAGRLSEACEQTRAGFSAYLDGALDGSTMAQLAAHMRECSGCRSEFEAWRSMHTALGELGPAPIPSELQARLRDTLAGELVIGSHRSPLDRFRTFLQRTLAPAGLRLGAGLTATLVILGSAACVVGTALPVQANDDRMAHLTAPKFLYSQTVPGPVSSRGRYLSVLVDAKVDAQGRVYDYELMDGPHDADTRLWVEESLLGSVFRPASVFGGPVAGHVMMTLSSIDATS